jgi:translation initiation factor IF-1
MVKNTQGGSSHKKFARSSMAPANKTYLRTAREEGEIYAYVSKMFGNGMCNVVDMNGRDYLCVIRGKFRGKNRKNNKLEIGTWTLVGLRGWESTKKDEKLTCDLLEIYTKEEIDRLKSTVRGNWKTATDEIGGGGGGGGGGGEDGDVDVGDNVVFSATDDIFEYKEMMKKEGAEGSKKISLATTASKNDWLCDEGEGEGDGDGKENEVEGEEGGGAGKAAGGGGCRGKQKHASRHINKRIEEYIDFDSI